VRCVWFVVLAGCNQIYGLDGTRAVDAPMCIPATTGDNFDAVMSNPCGAGFPSPPNGAGLTRTSGTLILRPPPGNDTDVGCTSPGFTIIDGAFIEVIGTLGDGGTYSQFALEDSTTRQNIGGIKVVHVGGVKTLFAFDAAQVTSAEVGYASDRMRWWRLRPAGRELAAEYSADAKAWTTFGMIATNLPATVVANIIGGTYEDVQAPGMMVVDNFNVCPP